MIYLHFSCVVQNEQKDMSLPVDVLKIRVTPWGEKSVFNKQWQNVFMSADSGNAL